MKSVFYLAILILVLFEILKVYFIMPFPGSQESNSISIAYFLYSFRWIFRILICILIIISLYKCLWKSRWIPLTALILMLLIAYNINAHLSADNMFLQPNQLVMKKVDSNQVDLSKIVIGIKGKNESRAYPIQYMGYHHQVIDSLDGEPVMVTYCTVCRTGRVYKPVVKNQHETFRLVGMDHYNAMFEDKSTKSWWRQSTGEAITGELKGEKLEEILYTQTSLQNWIQLNPGTLIMQADTDFNDEYDNLRDFETGKSKSALTGTDTSSWKKKSWVLGVKVNNQTKAYDWNSLVLLKIKHDIIGKIPILIVLSNDQNGVFAYERNSIHDYFKIVNDTLFNEGKKYRLDGTGIGNSESLKRIPVYQDFWLSWQTFYN